MLSFKRHSLKRIVSLLLFAALIFTSLPLQTFAMDNNTEQITVLVKQAEKERAKYGEAKDITINKLKARLRSIGIDTGSYCSDSKSKGTIGTFGYGEWHNINKTWRYRVDKPKASKSSSADAKPHVHVQKNGHEVGAENVDGTSSHGKTLKKVPKKIRKKVRESKDYQKGKKDLKKMKEAKAEIKNRHLNLKNAKDLVIAAGIFVTIVGVAFFAPEVLPVALAAI